MPKFKKLDYVKFKTDKWDDVNKVGIVIDPMPFKGSSQVQVSLPGCGTAYPSENMIEQISQMEYTKSIMRARPKVSTPNPQKAFDIQFERKPTPAPFFGLNVDKVLSAAQGIIDDAMNKGGKAWLDELALKGSTTGRMGVAKTNPVSVNKVDPVVEAVRRDLLNRSQVGIKKYGKTLDRQDIDTLGFMNHFYEELLDAANYAKRIIMDLEKNKK